MGYNLQQCFEIIARDLPAPMGAEAAQVVAEVESGISLHQAFETFVSDIPFYGFAVLCIDHPVVQGLIPRVSDRRIVTYGFSPQADIRATQQVRHRHDRDKRRADYFFDSLNVS